MKRSRHEPDQRVVLVTGATTGIGLALARQLIALDFRVVLTARASSLSRFVDEGIRESERVRLCALDVTCAEEANRLYAEIAETWQGVDVLINNAGVCYRAVIEHLSDEDEEQQFAINYLGPLHLIRLVLPYMRQRRQGHVINLSSVGGMMAMPTMGGYSASKFALEGASEALWYEMRPWNIHVTLIEPGFVRSNSFRNAIFTPKSKVSFENDSDPYHRYYTNLISLITRMMTGSSSTPDDIARTIIKIMNHNNPPLRVSATRDAVFFRLIRRLLPQRIYHTILYHGLPGIRSWVKREG